MAKKINIADVNTTQQLINNSAVPPTLDNTTDNTGITGDVSVNPRQAEIDAVNSARVAKGYKPIGNTEDATIDAAIAHGQQNGYYKPVTLNSGAEMQGGITNKAVNTSTSTETTDISGVQDATMNMIKAMRDEGLTYSQAFDKYYPKPGRRTDVEADLQKRQKAALFADMLRLATEGVGAFKGSTIQKRDQSQPYAGLAGKLAQEYASYSASMNEWQKKGIDAVMKDIQQANELYGKNLANAPKTKVSKEDNAWDREKFQTEQAFDEKKLKSDEAQGAADRRAANYRASVSAGNREPKQTQIIFADNNGGAVIENKKVDSLYNSAYQAMLSDPTFMNAGNKGSKQIEAINNDYSFEGKAAKIKVYVDQHAHESPKALELIKKNSTSYSRTDGANQSNPNINQGGQAPWLITLPNKNTNKAPWVK